MGYWVTTWVAGLIIPMLLAERSANQRLPSGPALIPAGEALAVGTGNSAMAWVAGLIIPTWLDSVNQRLPSGPPLILQGEALAVGTGNSAKMWVAGLISPILSALG